MRSLLIASLSLLLASCGAKTGLLIPDADLPYDAGEDAGFDAGIDAPVCMPQPVELERRGAQVVFALDRSNSMDDTLQGEDREEDDPRPSRWDIMGQTLGAVLGGADPLIEVGAKAFPSVTDSISTPEEACMIDSGLDLNPGPSRVPRLLRIFETTGPAGGTPTALALGEVERYFSSRPAPGVPRFVVLATDGGPNCNPDPTIDHRTCTCTGRPEDCLDAMWGPYNCLDEDDTLDTIRRLHDDLGIPVYVIGIVTRTDLRMVLDNMAVAGGRPREGGDGQRYYDAVEPGQLEEALTTITDSIARCVFELTPPPPADATLEVRLDGTLVAQDGTRTEGWDYTAPDQTEITLFGGACARVTASAAPVTAEILCEDD